ncbi:MAG: hypothetical protein Q4C30_00370 [Bacteroidia bacterium]|nr:hypothetical protein [Bacteroidia bacterium]
MKTTKLMWRTLSAACIAALAFVGCQEDLYSIDAPDGLQEEIDAIAAEREAEKNQQGDNETLIINTYDVGATDCSSGWWTAFSDYFKIPTGKMLVLEFVNHTTGANNWNNWNLCVTSPDVRDGDNYSEYFVLRSDNYGWGNDKYDGGIISNDYPDLDGDGDIWNDFRAIMADANVVMKVDHSKAGYCYVTAVATSADGKTTITETYNHPVSISEDIQAFLVADGSYMEMKKATLMPSEVAELVDYEPVSLSISNAPQSIVIGETDFWGGASATVTFADGSSAPVDTADVTFAIIPDLTTVGTKTIVLAYTKTKLGNVCKPVTGYYVLEVTNKIEAIDVKNNVPDFTYYYMEGAALNIPTVAFEITATYSDGTSSVMPNANCQFIPDFANGKMVVKYSDEVSAEVPVNFVKGSYAIGAPDFTNGWWTTFSPSDIKVEVGTPLEIELSCYSDNLENWHTPCYILRGAEKNEYCVVRSDNFGWGAGYDGNDDKVVESDWNFDTFKANMNGSLYKVKITNNGNGTADIEVNVTYSNGEVHFQNYKGIKVNSDDLYFTFVTEESYLVIK